MNKTLTMGVPVVLALWFGFSTGYHRGTREERQAWERTASIAWTTTEPVLQGVAKPGFHISYKNPHCGIMMIPSRHGITAVNRADPRVYRQYEHFSP